jgi:cell division protein FtsB
MDLNTRMILTLGLVSAIILFGIVIPGLKALLAVVEDAQRQRSVQDPALVEYEQHLAEEHAAAGPIDKAIEQVAREQ